MKRLPDIDPAEFEAIAGAISSDQSPVGIDARKTHVIILHLLLDLEKRMDDLEKKLDRMSG
jgi:hypothetical protein